MAFSGVHFSCTQRRRRMPGLMKISKREQICSAKPWPVVVISAANHFREIRRGEKEKGILIREKRGPRKFKLAKKEKMNILLLLRFTAAEMESDGERWIHFALER
jgi:hypothetical protein